MASPITGSVHASTQPEVDAKLEIIPSTPSPIKIHGSCLSRPGRPAVGVIMNVPSPPAAGVT